MKVNHHSEVALQEVDMEGAIRQAEARYAGDLRTLLRDEKLRYRSITR